MNAQDFLAKNATINCSMLADMLGVSSGTITKMKTEVTRIQSLALDALNAEQKAANLIDVDVTEWFDKVNGNTYFSAWVNFKGENYFLPFQYGYGSHCEDMALKLLSDKGLIPDEWRRYTLREKYNININTSSREGLKRDMYDGSERQLNQSQF